MFSACMCPHYSTIHHHYSRFDHYIDCFLCEPLTAVLICEQAVCNVRENGILRFGGAFLSSFFFCFLQTKSSGSSVTSNEILEIMSTTDDTSRTSALHPFKTR